MYRIAKRDGTESVVAVDQSAYTLDAARVVADTIRRCCQFIGEMMPKLRLFVQRGRLGAGNG